MRSSDPNKSIWRFEPSHDFSLQEDSAVKLVHPFSLIVLLTPEVIQARKVCVGWAQRACKKRIRTTQQQLDRLCSRDPVQINHQHQGRQKWRPV
jgi:hypothetical protein